MLAEVRGPEISEKSTLGGFLTDVCTRFSEREALVFEDQRWTYAELLRRAREVAGALVADGRRPGDVVGVLMSNRPEWVAAVFGAALAGCVAAPLSTFSTAGELAYLVRNARVALLLAQPTFGGREFDFPTDVRTVLLGEAYDAFLAAGSRVAIQVDPEQPALVIHSSGTTATPKGVLHNHVAPTAQFRTQARIFGRTEDTRLWSALPLFWTAGLNTALGATLAAGGCFVSQEGFDAGEALALMERERVTEPYTLPHQAKALAEHPAWETTDLSSLRCVFGKSVFARHPKVQGDPAWTMPVGYGMSETCAFVVAHDSAQPREVMKASLGTVLPGCVLRIVDPDSGATLARNETGEIAVSGATLMQHYLGKTRHECLDENGFFRTGDLGVLDDDGCLHWEGRRTELIKTGGVNVSPAEIEVQLRALPAVKLARVVGVPTDDPLDSTAVLCVELTDGAECSADDIRAFLRARLSAYKVPKQVLFFPPGSIPMTGSGTKVKDEELKVLVKERLA